MKIISVACFGLLLAACGGASEDGGRQEETVGNQDDDDEESADAGRGDDSEDDDSEDDDSEDDDSEDDDSEDDDGPADDDGADDDVTGDDDGTSDDDGPADDDVAGDDDVTGDDDAVADDDVTGDDDIVADDDVTSDDDGTSDDDTSATECQLSGQSAGQGYCYVEQQCANGFNYTDCSQLANGAWSCRCYDNFGTKELEVTSDTSPCSMVAEACPTIELPAFDGEESCTLESQSASTDFCNLQTRCTQSVEFSDTIDIVQSRYETTSCRNTGTALSCSCNSESGAKQFTIAEITATEACPVAEQLCDPEIVPEPVSEETCETSVDNSDPGSYCQRTDVCTQSVSVDGVLIDLNGQEYASCSTDAQGVTTCSCYNSDRSYSFEAGSEASAELCTEAQVVCATAEPPVTEGPVTCDVIAQSSYQAGCYAQVQCAQQATVGGSTVELFGNIDTNCQQNGDSYSCQCSSTAESASITVSAEDAWSACTAAADQCQDAVAVEIGPGPGQSSPCYGGYPMPLPEPAPAGSSSDAGVASSGSSSSGGSAAPDVGVGVPIPCYY